jgi:chromosome segregation ATPase
VEVIGTAISAIIAAGGTVLVVTAAVLIGGIVVVARRRTRPAQVEAGIRRRAGSALVRADDRLAEGEADVEFAVAQFGERAAQEYRGVLRRAQTDRDEIFRLHRMIDDDPGAGLANRERADRIVMLADRIERLLDEQAGAFRQRRSLESTAPERLERLRSRIAEARGRLATATTQRDALLEQHARTALGPAVDAPERAARALDRAEGQAADAAPGSTAPASSVMATIAEAERLLFSAEEALEQIDATAARLGDAVAALEALRADARSARTEALAAVDAAPDGDTGAAITAAVSELDAALAATGADAGSPADSPADPLEQLDELRQAMDAVELALASSRTQAQRLTHALEAYHAARVQAEAQVLAARDAIGQRGSAGARARLDEAVDELRASRAMLDTDPVGALDAVRRALTHARDAEVLARY